MALVKNDELCLWKIEEVEFEDKKTNETVIKQKLYFFDKDNHVVIGWLDQIEKDLQPDDISNFEKSKARNTVWNGKLWNDQIKWQLQHVAIR